MSPSAETPGPIGPTAGLTSGQVAAVRSVVRDELRSAGLRVPSEPIVQNASRTHCGAPYSAVGSHPAAAQSGAVDPTERAGKCDTEALQNCHSLGEALVAEGLGPRVNDLSETIGTPGPLVLVGLSGRHVDWLAARHVDVWKDERDRWCARIEAPAAGEPDVRHDDIGRLRPEVHRKDEALRRANLRIAEMRAAIERFRDRVSYAYGALKKGRSGALPLPEAVERAWINVVVARQEMRRQVRLGGSS